MDRRASRLAPLLVLLAVATGGCLRARGTPEEPVVTGVELRGARALDGDDVLEKLATQPSDRWAWQEARRLDPDALSVDRRRVEAYYRERGYYDARVRDVQVRRDGRGRARVIFEVEEGAPIRVRAVVVDGLDAAPEARARVGRLPLREGEIFTEGAYDATRGRILSALRNTGWANAEVTQQARILTEEHAAEVRYEVKPGRRWKFGPILPAGSAAVARERIRREASVDVTPGDWYAEEQLAKAQARVFGLGVFGGVRVIRGTPDPQRGTIPIVVAVREAPFRTLRAGAGVGVESNVRWDVHGVGGWTHRNFLGDLRRVQLELRAGYAWLLTTSPREGPVMLASAEFSQPGAISRRIDASIRLEVERGLQQAYAFWSERLRLGLPLRLAPRWTVVPSYNLEVFQLEDVVQSFDPSRPQDEGPELQNCSGNVCLLSYLEQRVAYDGRDDPINTRRGVYASLAVQEGFNLGGYGYRYLRVLPEARAYVPLGDATVFAVRGRLGALAPVDEEGPPPIVARFQGGGPLSMRGYDTGRLSPMIFRNGDWVPVGGNGLVDGSAELRFDLSGSWGGALFLDGGYVSRPTAVPSGWQAVLDPSRLQLASGLGLRYRTPFGPIRLDAGFMIPSDWSADVPFRERFPTVPSVENAGDALPEGGVVPAFHRERWFAIHLSIGEAF